MKPEKKAACRRGSCWLILPLLYGLTACSSLSQWVGREPADLFSVDSGPGSQVVSREEVGAYAGIRGRLVAGAEAVLGTGPVRVRGRGFNADCTGTILAIYYYAGIDLSRDFYKYRGNGVSILYQMLEDFELTYDTRYPLPGDIIFWDNTWDANGDGLWNDPLTHIGMVVSVEENGQLEYIHYNYRKGNVYASMNLNDPDSYSRVIDGRRVIVNDAMRMREEGKPHPPRWLSSHLYRIFARGYMLEEESGD